MQGSLRCLHPVASRERPHVDKEDKLLDSEWQLDISRYRQLPHNRRIQKFLVYYHTSNIFSIALSGLLDYSYYYASRTLKVCDSALRTIGRVCFWRHLTTETYIRTIVQIRGQ